MIRPALLGLCLATPTFAEPVLDGDLRHCIANHVSRDLPKTACMIDIHRTCLAWPVGQAAGTACFVDAKTEWGEHISARMAEIAKTETEEIRAIAGIEVKYALQRNLLSCDRHYELSLIARDPDDEIIYARARCEAEAVADSYLHLLYQSNAFGWRD